MSKWNITVLKAKNPMLSNIEGLHDVTVEWDDSKSKMEDFLVKFKVVFENEIDKSHADSLTKGKVKAIIDKLTEDQIKSMVSRGEIIQEIKHD